MSLPKGNEVDRQVAQDRVQEKHAPQQHNSLSKFTNEVREHQTKDGAFWQKHADQVGKQLQMDKLGFPQGSHLLGADHDGNIVTKSADGKHVDRWNGTTGKKISEQDNTSTKIHSGRHDFDVKADGTMTHKVEKNDTYWNMTRDALRTSLGHNPTETEIYNHVKQAEKLDHRDYSKLKVGETVDMHVFSPDAGGHPAVKTQDGANSGDGNKSNAGAKPGDGNKSSDSNKSSDTGKPAETSKDPFGSLAKHINLSDAQATTMAHNLVKRAESGENVGADLMKLSVSDRDKVGHYMQSENAADAAAQKSPAAQLKFSYNKEDKSGAEHLTGIETPKTGWSKWNPFSSATQNFDLTKELSPNYADKLHSSHMGHAYQQLLLDLDNQRSN